MSLKHRPIDTHTCEKPRVVHLNNAGSSLMPQCVLDTQLAHLQLEAEIGGYEAAAREAARIEAVYDSVAQLINCHRDEVAVVENATVGWMMAFYAIPFKAGDRILTAEAEYASNYLAYLQIAKQKGVSVEVIPSNTKGEVCTQSLEAMIDESVKLISITHIPTNSGLVNPVEEIGVIAKRHNILYLVDACQSAGQMPLDVERIQCDMLSATARKYLRGPRGVGFLYVRKKHITALHPPMIDLLSATWISPTQYQLREDARRFENWENNYAAKLGLGSAVDYALDMGLEHIEADVAEKAQQLRRRLASIPEVTLRDIGKKLCGLVTFTTDGIDAADLTTKLRAHNINVSCSKPSSTLLDAIKRDLPNVVRASVHYYNNDEEFERFEQVLKSLLRAPKEPA